jgi:hypothetical protein
MLMHLVTALIRAAKMLAAPRAVKAESLITLKPFETAQPESPPTGTLGSRDQQEISNQRL